MNYKKLLEKTELRLSKIFNYFEKHLLLTLLILFIISLLVRLYFTPFSTPLREDAYAYVIKSSEIAQGNFTPMLSHAIGWPIFLSPFYYLFKEVPIFQYMVFVRFIYDLIGALLIFPIAYIGKKLLDKRSLIILMVLFTFYPSLIESGISGLPAPLFTFLFLLTVYFIIKCKENKNYILLAAIFGGLAYYVRINGLLILPIIFMRKNIPKFKYGYIFYIMAIFLLVSAPMLYQRYVYFDSSFSYGPTSKYLVDNYQQVWSNNVKVPSLFDYLETHTISDIINKFFIRGFLSVLFTYFYFSISPILLIFLIYGMIYYFNDKRFVPFYLVLILWVMSLSIVFDIFNPSRYLYPTIPLLLIFISLSIKDIFNTNRFKNILLTILLVTFALFSLVFLMNHERSLNEINSKINEGLIWSEWVANNIKGKIAIIEGGDLIMMHLPDTTVSGVGINIIGSMRSPLILT